MNTPQWETHHRRHWLTFATCHASILQCGNVYFCQFYTDDHAESETFDSLDAAKAHAEDTIQHYVMKSYEQLVDFEATEKQP